MFSTRVILLAVVSCPLVLCQIWNLATDVTKNIAKDVTKEIKCTLESGTDVTEGFKNEYATFVQGSKDWESSDVIKRDHLDASLPTITYTLDNFSMSGMSGCVPELVRLVEKCLEFDYHLRCPHIIYRAQQYETHGELAANFIEGKGTSRVDHYDYVFKLHGNYVKNLDENQKEHIQIKNYNVDIDARGKVVYDYKNLYNGDTVKSALIHTFANTNWKLVDFIVRAPIMEAIMEKFVENLNSYLKVTPLDTFNSHV